MELIYESTAGFEEDMARLDASERKGVVAAVNERGLLFHSKKRRAFYKGLTQPVKIRLRHDWENGYYLMPVGENLRVMIAAEDDPIFDRTLVTLMRVVPTDDATAVFKDMSQRYYRAEGLLDESDKANGKSSQTASRSVRSDSRRRKVAAHNGAQGRVSRRPRRAVRQ